MTFFLMFELAAVAVWMTVALLMGWNTKPPQEEEGEGTGNTAGEVTDS